MLKKLNKNEFVLFTVKKGQDKVASLFISPASEKGRSTLRLGDNMWLYIPNVAKPVRITSLQSVVRNSLSHAAAASPASSGWSRRARASTST